MNRTERSKRRERIMRVRPWEKSTGPRTVEGKARACMNAYRHGERSAEPRLRRLRQAAWKAYRTAYKADDREAAQAAYWKWAELVGQHDAARRRIRIRLAARAAE